MSVVNTKDLEGAALDWAVANAVKSDDMDSLTPKNYRWYCNGTDPDKLWSPSTDWSQIGPLIEEHSLTIVTGNKSGWCAVKDWSMGVVANTYPDGETHLIAACRAIVAAKLGAAVDVPDELISS